MKNLSTGYVAVLTGDVVASTKLDEGKRRELNEVLKTGLERLPEVRHDTFRGDGFQVVLPVWANALRYALRIRCELMSRLSDEKGQPVDTRISIGIGTITIDEERIAESDGDAYRWSGWGLDELMKSRENRLRVATPDSRINAGFEAICALLDGLLSGYSAKQAAVVAGLLNELKQQEIAENLGISQPAVHQHAQLARWFAVNRVLRYFEQDVFLSLQNDAIKRSITTK